MLQASDLVVVTTSCTVPSSIQQALAQAGLMCDGHLAVDAIFTTNDYRNLAAVTIVNFSCR